MGLIEVVARLVVAIGAMIVAASVFFLNRERVIATLRHPDRRLRDVAPHVCLLVAVLLVNRAFRHLGQEVSWLIGWNITGVIYAIEGKFVATVQTFATPLLTDVFSLTYLYGYAFLVSFPIVIYWVLEDSTPLRKTLVAYSINYGLGLVLYTLFVSFGPRNLLPEAVKPLLYATRPETQLLTSTVNANTNVFPSLHASLSVTVVLLARRTREEYPGWYPVSVSLAALVVVSTIYLGIHWAIDVLAGVLLAFLSVRVADRYYRLERVRSLGSALAISAGREQRDR